MGAGTGRYRVTWFDVSEWVREWGTEHAVTVVVHLRLGLYGTPPNYVDVVLRDGLNAPAALELTRVRYPLHKSDDTAWPANVLYALNDAADQYSRSPWYWSTKDRQKAIQEA